MEPQANIEEDKGNVPPPKNVDNRVVRCLKCGSNFNLRDLHICRNIMDIQVVDIVPDQTDPVNLAKHEEFFKKLHILCAEYKVTHLGGRGMDNACIAFDGLYYYVSYTRHWIDEDDKEIKGDFLLEFSRFVEKQITGPIKK